MNIIEYLIEASGKHLFESTRLTEFRRVSPQPGHSSPGLTPKSMYICNACTAARTLHRRKKYVHARRTGSSTRTVSPRRVHTMPDRSATHKAHCSVEHVLRISRMLPATHPPHHPAFTARHPAVHNLRAGVHSCQHNPRVAWMQQVSPTSSTTRSSHVHKRHQISLRSLVGESRPRGEFGIKFEAAARHPPHLGTAPLKPGTRACRTARVPGSESAAHDSSARYTRRAGAVITPTHDRHAWTPSQHTYVQPSRPIRTCATPETLPSVSAASRNSCKSS